MWVTRGINVTKLHQKISRREKKNLSYIIRVNCKISPQGFPTVESPQLRLTVKFPLTEINCRIYPQLRSTVEYTLSAWETIFLAELKDKPNLKSNYLNYPNLGRLS